MKRQLSDRLSRVRSSRHFRGRRQYAAGTQLLHTSHSDVEIFTRLTPEARLIPIFEALYVPIVICGHTHMQFDRTIGATRVVNAGSVGMPFGEPGAHWLLLGPSVELRRTPYDFEKAAERVRATGYPGAEEFAAGSILQPPSELAMLEKFSKAQLS